MVIIIGAVFVIVGIPLFIIGAFLQQFDGPSPSPYELLPNPSRTVADNILAAGIFMIIIGAAIGTLYGIFFWVGRWFS